MYLQYIVVVAWNAILSLLAQAIDVPSIRLLNTDVPSAKTIVSHVSLRNSPEH